MGAGVDSNVIRILVPLVADEALLDRGFEILAESFAVAGGA